MTGSLIVMLKIVAIFLVILIGWAVRRRGYLGAETTSALSRLVVDITLPALIFTQFLRTVTPAALRADWYLPLAGAAVVAIGEAAGLAMAAVFGRRAHRPTLVFLVAIANWIYLPLPIAQTLYGDQGVRIVLLSNVGVQVMLWTMGVRTLRGGKSDAHSLRLLLTNPGLIATAAGIGLALLVPAARTLEAPARAGAPALVLGAGAPIQALVMVGSLTIPLSLIMTGAQLGGLDLSSHRPSLALGGALMGRLVVTPVAVAALLFVLAEAGAGLPPALRTVFTVIAGMPSAVSCSIFTDRYGGDTALAARAIFFGTLASMVTIPAWLFLIARAVG